MKLSPYLHLTRLEFIVTYRCTGHCLHCSLGDRTTRSDGFPALPADLAADTVRRLSQYAALSSVMTFGGEPLLYSDTVCAIHRTARECGIPTRQVITNGFFSSDPKKILITAEALVSSGVNDLLLSVDAFHQRTIPLEPVRCFANALKQAGIPSIRLSPAWVVNRTHSNPYNEKTEEILADFASLGIPVSAGNDIFLSGNAAKYLSEYYPTPHPDFTLPCGSAPYTDPLSRVTSLSVEPNGDVTACAFVIGNLFRESIDEIITRYDPTQDEAMNAVLTGGVPALATLAESRGIQPDFSGVCTACDACRKLAKQLQKR